MKIVDMVMPPLGESIMECTVLGWLKQPGDSVEADDSILEVATDKVDTEVPCPISGVIKEILVQEGDVVEIGQPVARLEVSEPEEAPQTAPLAPELPTPPSEATSGEHDPVTVDDQNSDEGNLQEQMAGFGLPALSNRMASPLKSSFGNNANNGFFSPLVLSIAKEEGISMQDLLTIQGTGAEARVTKNDLGSFIKKKDNGTAAVVPALKADQLPKAGGVEVQEMNRMRKIIAQRMKESQSISAHVTSFIETDMTAIVQWREKNKQVFRHQNGTSITYTPILIEAVVKAIRDFPLINISVEGDNLLVRKDINIGMGVALADGNLIVPVIRQADQYSLVGLAKMVNDLAERARTGRLKADDLAGGTYTISNIGTFGNLMGTPVIVQPQVAIMAFGAIVKKPAVIESPQGDLLGIRQKMFISHSYDHRVVDGSLGGLFLKKVSDYLEEFDPNRSIV